MTLSGVNFQPVNVRLILVQACLHGCLYCVADLSPTLQLRNIHFAADTAFQQFCFHKIKIFSHELRLAVRVMG